MPPMGQVGCRRMLSFGTSLSNWVAGTMAAQRLTNGHVPGQRQSLTWQVGSSCKFAPRIGAETACMQHVSRLQPGIGVGLTYVQFWRSKLGRASGMQAM